MSSIEPKVHWILTAGLVLAAIWSLHADSTHKHLDAHIGAEKRISNIERRLDMLEDAVLNK